MEVFPASLPYPKARGFAFSDLNTRIVPDMPGGFEARLRSKTYPLNGKLMWVFSTAEFSTFEGFYKSALQQGRKWFSIEIKIGESARVVTAKLPDQLTIKSIGCDKWRITAPVKIKDLPNG